MRSVCRATIIQHRRGNTPSENGKKSTFRLFADNVLNKRYWKDTGASYGDTFCISAHHDVRLSVQYNF